MRWLCANRRVFLVLTVALVASLSAGSSAAAQGGPPESIIVVLQDSVTDPGAVADEHARQHGAQVEHVYRSALKGYAAVVPAPARAAIARDPRVQFISEDREVQAFDTLPTGVNRVDAEIATGTGFAATPGFAAAVLDTGIDLNHPDLNAAAGKSCIKRQPVQDGNGHGTHVAGTIGAKNGNGGVVGVVPGIKLFAVKVLNNSGSGTWSSVICGIDWVTANASALSIKVANMSLGGSGADDGNCGLSNKDALHKAICGSAGAGVTYVAAAGNSGANLAGFVPATYGEVIAATALGDYNGQSGGGAAPTCANYGADDTFASFSNYAGAADQGHTIGAPGVCILSTWKGGNYATMSGTSMASPHVAGSAALYLTSHPGATPGQVLDALRASGEPNGAGHTDPSGLHPEPVVRANAAYQSP